MKATLTILLSGLLLCGCSQKQTTSTDTPKDATSADTAKQAPTSAAIDLVQAGKDTTWRDGYVLHVTKRDGASLFGVTISAKLPTGQTQTFSADTATLSAVPNADDSSVMVTLHGAKRGGATVGEYPIALHK